MGTKIGLINEKIKQKKREMQRNIQQRILKCRFNYVHECELHNGTGEKWRDHDRLSIAHVDRINMHSRITNFSNRKRKCISNQKICNASTSKADTTQMGRRVSLETPLGFFQMLPRELLHNLFDRISVHQLVIISLTSSIFNSEVRHYLLLENASRKFSAETTTHMMKNVLDLDPFYVWEWQHYKLAWMGSLLHGGMFGIDLEKRMEF
ncbi:unnamed protein product [Onchocerca flexuosa]|uniref:F-box domain-containing protein n=1 Tax=Onchocerca flexuosa TaxID=387005 RepID=A0A183H0V1_9BILA|nr:unnamed protein product [Onchocerca flexuosa]